MEKPKVAFLIPAYGSIGLQSWTSHINLIMNAGKFCSLNFIIYSSSIIHKARNTLVEMFIEADKQMGFDYAFWLDSDIVFSPEHCEKLIEKIRENPGTIVSGLYLNQAGNSIKPMATIYSREEDRYDFVERGELEKELIEVDGGGLGFTIQTAESLMKMVKEHGKLFGFRTSKRGTMIGEDNYFFELAKKQGYKVMLAPKIKVGHEKAMVI